MISTNEFHIAVASACSPLSLILPASSEDGAMLVGKSTEGKTAILFLTGPYKFSWHFSEGAHYWSGLVFFPVRIEMDETSTFSPQSVQAPMGSLIREGTSLIARAKPPEARGRNIVILEEALPPTEELSVGFTRWQVVLGHGTDKRVLIKVGQPADSAPLDSD